MLITIAILVILQVPRIVIRIIRQKPFRPGFALCTEAPPLPGAHPNAVAYPAGKSAAPPAGADQSGNDPKSLVLESETKVAYGYRDASAACEVVTYGKSPKL